MRRGNVTRGGARLSARVGPREGWRGLVESGEDPSTRIWSQFERMWGMTARARSVPRSAEPLSLENRLNRERLHTA